VVAIAHRAGLEGGRIGARAGLGQAIAGDGVHRREPGQQTLALSLRAEGVDHPGGHVVDRHERRRGRTGARQRLEHDGRIGSAEPCPADVVLHIEAGKSKFGAGLEHIARENLVFVPLRGMGRHVLGGKIRCHLAERRLFFAQLEVHARAPLRLSRGI
jgi:hypothetical protein